MVKSRNLIVMVAGLPGSGKSFFAKRLASEIEALYLSSDELRKQIGLRGRYLVGDKLTVYEELCKRACLSIQDQQSVIMDATFYLQSVREKVYDLAEKLSCNLIMIYVHADEKLIKDRLLSDREDSEADFQVYLKIKNQYEPIHREHLKLESTNENIVEMLDKALNYISIQDGKA